MPKRRDIKKVMIIGSGPIIIGQAAEFDFSGSQASRSLREEGYKTIVVNSNPATIQTDPQIADIVYIEPLNVETLAKIIEMEEPDGLLPGFGGQTALNLSFRLAREGILDKLEVELLGSNRETIEAAENRESFRGLMAQLGEPIPKSVACHTIDEIRQATRTMSYPVLVRPAYTLGGTGSGVAYDWRELQEIASSGIRLSQIGQVLIEESVLGWKEFEYEVMRDGNDNCITICSMENLNPMGVHTGESIVFAPAQTLTDPENQILRSVSLKIIRALKICGGCNIQFAVDPKRWAYRVIEVNPRVSRSSALASKATGYPIARVSAKIAVGMNLDEIPNAVTKKTTAAFEPALDYVVAKIPRWPFDKFPTVDRRITTQMKSTGEAMAIGSTIEESMLKAIRSLEINQFGFEPEPVKEHELIRQLEEPTDRLLFCIAEALRRGYTVKKISQLSSIDPFFITKIAKVIGVEKRIHKEKLNADLLYEAKRIGFADEEIARLVNKPVEEIRSYRESCGIVPHFNMVDTCAGEFEAITPYYYSTYMAHTGIESRTKSGKRILIIGSGPIRIGQGIEFDYCCVHAALALKDTGFEAIMMNNNPETVSTDFDVSSRLYFEPLVLEDVLNVIEKERPGGIILQFGGQTSINLAMPLAELVQKGELDIEILGTQPADIHHAEDRERFSSLLKGLDIRQPPFGTGYTFGDVKAVAASIGYPVIVRPSYVLGGRAMEIVYEEQGLEQYMDAAVRVSRRHPVLVDKYIANAVEVDVDAMCDGDEVFIGGVMEHIEQAGVHSGDSYCVIPPRTLKNEAVHNIEMITEKIALALNTRGLINIQFAIQNGEIYVLEANPRASRTIPYVSKTIGVPLAKLATLILIGHSIEDLRRSGQLPNLGRRRFVSVKGPVFPFQKLVGVDPILGPEMKSTGEVMAIDRTFGAAYFKAIMSDERFSRKGTVYITVRDDDKPKVLDLVKSLIELGFKVVATRGTADFLRREGVVVDTVYRISEHKSPNALDLMRQRRIDLIINTPSMTHSAKRDGYVMRRLAVELGIPFITALTSAEAEVEAIKFAQRHSLVTRPLHEYHIRPS
ncbi:MAG: carbamoyl-phosphate synthase large subunit [candidate division WOR-3 bacterium]|nr:MAG: carbamoyl-phosphate synthase large subunit [candidate division WOR-3 bacterium]